MRRILCLCLFLLIPDSSFAQEVVQLDDAGVLPPQSTSMAPVMPSVAPASVAASAPAVVSEAVKPLVALDVVPTATEFKQAVDAFPVIKGAIQAPTVFGVCSAIALMVNLTISYLRKRGSLTSRKRVKQFLAFAVALSGGLALVTPGMSWVMAAFVALSPLLAVAAHELRKTDK